MNKRAKTQLRRFLKILVGCALASSTYLYLSPSSPYAPEIALAQALDSIEKERYSDAQELLNRAADKDALSHWVSFFRAHVFEKEGKLDEALNLYRKIEDSSAASLDKKVALLRLSTKTSLQELDSDSLGQAIIELEKELRHALRQDLIGELYLIQAKLTEKNSEPDLALALYQKVRKLGVDPIAAKMARKELSRIESSHPEFIREQSLAYLFDEATLFLQEGDSLSALSRIQLAKNRVSDNSTAYFEALLIEERILRALGRQREADHLLSLVSSHSGLGTADRALFKMARNAWNEDNHKQSLAIFEEFEKRFPKSTLANDAKYLKARVLEELGQIAEAKNVYLLLSRNSEDTIEKVRAYRRLAWLFLRDSEPLQSRDFFHKAAVLAESERQVLLADSTLPNIDKTRHLAQVLEDISHAMYWKNYSLSLLDEDTRISLNLRPLSKSKLHAALKEVDPLGYYTVLTAKDAKSETPEAESTSGKDKCVTEIPEELSETLELLSKAKLQNLAKHEIDWYFSKHASLHKNPEALSPPFGPETTSLHTTRANLYMRYSSPPHAISLASLLLNSENIKTCNSELMALSYPTPHLSFFKKATATYKLPLSLLLALARTESRFDERAVSTKNAQGLLQLLPSTAKIEGLAKNADLFDPATNISLGAKHLSKLLSHFEGEKIYALAAYNAGSSAVNRWRTRYDKLSPEAWVEMIGYPETKNYVKRVTAAAYIYEKLRH